MHALTRAFWCVVLFTCTLPHTLYAHYAQYFEPPTTEEEFLTQTAAALNQSDFPVLVIGPQATTPLAGMNQVMFSNCPFYSTAYNVIFIGLNHVKDLTQKLIASKTLDLLAVSGEHGNFGYLLGYNSAKLTEDVIDPLKSKKIKAKIILLDVCLTASFIKSFKELLTEDGIIIACIPTANTNIFDSGFLDEKSVDKNVKTLIREKIENFIVSLGSMCDKPMQDDNPAILNKFPGKEGVRETIVNNSGRLDLLGQFSFIKIMPCSYCIYKKETNELFYDILFNEKYTLNLTTDMKENYSNSTPWKDFSAMQHYFTDLQLRPTKKFYSWLSQKECPLHPDHFLQPAHKPAQQPHATQQPQQRVGIAPFEVFVFEGSKPPAQITVEGLTLESTIGDLKNKLAAAVPHLDGRVNPQTERLKHDILNGGHDTDNILTVFK